MSYEEFQSWVKYRVKHGPMDVRMRIDRAMAVLTTRLTGGKMVDYMPWPRAPSIDEKEAVMAQESEANLRSLFGGIVADPDQKFGKDNTTGKVKWRRNL